MIQLLVYFFIGIALSMDAFSIALSIGTTSPSNKIIRKTSIIVGIFHYIMPTLGSIVGNIFEKQVITISNYIIGTIFFLLAINMFINKNKEDLLIIRSAITIIVLAFSVSLDSFSVGIALGITKGSIIISGVIFMIISSTLTYIGFYLGKKMHYKTGVVANYIGIFIMILISLKYLIFA